MAARFQVQYGFVSTSAASGTVVPSQAGQSILVLQMCCIVSSATNIQFSSSTGPVNVSTLFPLSQNGGFVLPYSQVGWFQTAAVGDALNFTQSGTATVAIQIVWCPI